VRPDITTPHDTRKMQRMSTFARRFAVMRAEPVDAPRSACSLYRMSTTADPVAVFNAQLAASKLAALRFLHDLMTTLTDPRARVGEALREARLTATAILRARPMTPDTRDTSAPPSRPPHTPDLRPVLPAPTPPDVAPPHSPGQLQSDPPHYTATPARVSSLSRSELHIPPPDPAPDQRGEHPHNLPRAPPARMPTFLRTG
jgi:hypothetical protein